MLPGKFTGVKPENKACEHSLGLTMSQPSSTSEARKPAISLRACAGVK